MNIKDDFILFQINEGYLVGGAVRDYLNGKIGILDRDIAIKGAKEFAHKIAAAFDATFVTLDEENRIYRIVLADKKNYLDISELQGETIEQDLLRRDFTINAIAYDLKAERFIDVTGGMDDIKNRFLRHIKDENFREDPLRILRAFRFMAVTGFAPTLELSEAINKYKTIALNPAKERIMYEIMKLFGGKYCVQALLEMDRFGILEMIFPYVKEMKLVPPNSHHHLDLFHHSLETVAQIELLYGALDEESKKHMDSIDFGGFSRINHLKLSGFLHDIGKYSTWTIEGGQYSGICGQEYMKLGISELGIRHRFISHNDVGAEMVIPFLREMKFSKKQIEYISKMIKNHIYPSNVIAAPELTDKIMMRFIRKMESDSIDNIILAKADRLSARGVDITDDIVNTNINGLSKLHSFYLEKKEFLKPLPKLLDGYEIMELKNIGKTPELGKIISAIKEAQMSGEIITKEDAIEFVKKLD